MRALGHACAQVILRQKGLGMSECERYVDRLRGDLYLYGYTRTQGYEDARELCELGVNGSRYR